ncbi:hypothetical protein [Streptomyces sp. NPDC059970]|uniref:hypothetical protein n=1 Tax=Streptomyces sp. NPDC059970 TaxID=3347019 RepID=UPI003679D050
MAAFSQRISSRPREVSRLRWPSGMWWSRTIRAVVCHQRGDAVGTPSIPGSSLSMQQ